MATLSDPTDKAIYYQRHFRANVKERFKVSQHLEKFCPDCNLQTLDHSAHCRKCNRCCHKFDHHCIWLNNCIGADNYNLFLVATVSLELLVMTNFGFFLTFLIVFEQDYKSFESVSVLVSLFFHFLIFWPITEVILTHVWLTYHGITTFTYIIYERQKTDK